MKRDIEVIRDLEVFVLQFTRGHPDSDLSLSRRLEIETSLDQSPYEARSQKALMFSIIKTNKIKPPSHTNKHNKHNISICISFIVKLAHILYPE